MRKLLIVPALAFALAAGAGQAFASDDDGPASPNAKWMSIAQITEKLTAQGYDVRKVKVEGNGYEVYAIAKDGSRLEAELDPMTGAILKTEADD